MSPSFFRRLVLFAGFSLCALDGPMGFAQQLAPQVVAHRGASHDAPENTLSSFRQAWQQGADAIEGDFYLTADNEIVCLHDSDTARTGDRKVPVGQSTLAELRKVDVGAWRGDKFRGERIPTLAEVLRVVPADKKLFLEVKCGPQIVPFLKQELERSRLKPSQVVIISFFDTVIDAARKQLPEVRAYWLCALPASSETKRPQVDVAKVLETLHACGATGVGLQAEKGRLSKDAVTRLHADGFDVNCWTIDDAHLAREYQALGVDSITTDRPALMRNILTSLDTPPAEENP
jgi:glycerophosphoryl diester phosphodiesterase